MTNDQLRTEAARIAALPAIAEKGGIDYLRGLVREVGRAMVHGNYSAGEATYEMLCSAGFEDGGAPNGLGTLVMRSAEVAIVRCRRH